MSTAHSNEVDAGQAFASKPPMAVEIATAGGPQLASEGSDFALRRRMMVDCQVRTFDVTQLSLIDAMLDVPREVFVPADQQALAYSDQRINVAGEGGDRRVMLAPMVLARLIQALDIVPGARVLDVAGGTGYGAAIMARMGARVTALETGFAGAARGALAMAGAEVEVVSGAIEAGKPIDGGYDAILLNGAFELMPDALVALLKPEGRLAAIDAREGAMKAVILRPAGSGISRQPLFSAVAPVLPPYAKPAGFHF